MMNTHKGDILVRRLDEWRFAVAVDGVVRYVGSRVECERRAAILVRGTILGPRTERCCAGRGWPAKTGVTLEPAARGGGRLRG